MSKVLTLGEGDQTDTLLNWLAVHGSDHCAAINGQGVGITIISQPILMNIWTPLIRGLTIAPASGDALTLVNPGTPRLDNVELLAPYGGCGLKVRLDDTNLNDHPSPGVFQVDPEPARDGKRRLPLSYEMRGCRTHAGCYTDVRIYGHGDGLVLERDDTNIEHLKGTWFNYQTFHGGTIQVEGISVGIYNNAGINTEFHGLDITSHHGFHIEHTNGFVHWYGRTPEIGRGADDTFLTGDTKGLRFHGSGELTDSPGQPVERAFHDKDRYLKKLRQFLRTL